MLTLHRERGRGRGPRRELCLRATASWCPAPLAAALRRAGCHGHYLQDLCRHRCRRAPARARRVARGHGKRSSSDLPLRGTVGGTPQVRVRPRGSACGCRDRSSTTDVCIGAGRGEEGDGTLNFYAGIAATQLHVVRVPGGRAGERHGVAAAGVPPPVPRRPQ
jgi:hypothetical protein